MPSHSLLDDERHGFCRRLKAARERKGLALERIADATKIPASLFAAFERNDLHRWPTGLFRRAFFREYARMLDVPLAEACGEFNRLFAGDASGNCPRGEASDRADDLRLVLDAEWHGPQVPVVSRLLAALIDAGIILVIAATLVWPAPIEVSAALVLVTLAYFSIGTVMCGESPAKWIIARRGSLVEAFTLRHSYRRSASTGLTLAARQAGNIAAPRLTATSTSPANPIVGA